MSDLILSPPSLSKTDVSKETLRYHNPLAKEKGVTKIFRGNATSVSLLNVMIFKLCDRGSTGLSKGLYITKINFDVIERKKSDFVFRVSFVNKYTCTNMFLYWSIILK